MINFANDALIALRFVGHNRHGRVQSHTLNRLVQKGFSGLRVPSCSEAKIDHLTVRVDSPPQVSPPAAHPDIGLINMPIDTGPAQKFFRSFGQFRSEFLNPAIHRRPINSDPALCEQIHNVLVGQWIAQISLHRAKDDVARKTVMLEWGSARHAQPQKPKAGRRRRLTQQSHRFYALAGDPPARPGLVKGTTGSGAPIAVELWSLPVETVGSFLKDIPAPLGIGTVDLSDGRQVKGFICEAEAIADSADITQLGDWRQYLAQV